ncbi:unnamed protein product [Pocillopora meandrina]|uniref:Uncharacterized protein n=1 Tax=Pocillopora meandrina TaxID=46732 RepID=A0AAU9XCS8_9CNID|nr:unnamed protein product [Pocillopora meandrina]
MEESLRKFAEENFGKRCFPALHGEIDKVQPLTMVVQKNRPLWKRPFVKLEVIVLAELAKYVKSEEDTKAFRDYAKCKIKEEMLISSPHETIAMGCREQSLGVGVGGILEGNIRLSNDQGVLKLGKLSQKYIDDPDLRSLLAKTAMDPTLMKSFAEGDKLLLITSVVYSEKFELTGQRKEEAEVNVDGVPVASPFFNYFKTTATKMHARNRRSTQHPKVASRPAHAPLLFKCCAVDYIKEENRLEIRKGEYVGKVVAKDTTAEGLVKRDDEDYDNTSVEIFSDETDGPAPLTPQDVKKLDSMLQNVLLPVKNIDKRKEQVRKYLRWFEAAMVSEQDEVLIKDSVAPDDCELLKLASLSASEGSTVLDMSSLTKPDIHGYVVVLKHLLELTDEKWRKLEQYNAESD